ncbi:hypothetical protein, partial [Azospirillum sp. TSO22-1]|uniref:hypothetical protein n=1 Tax=Azospirillum sp. TSO22-1 TaxID=716789 RepID=UPI001B3BE8A5
MATMLVVLDGVNEQPSRGRGVPTRSRTAFGRFPRGTQEIVIRMKKSACQLEGVAPINRSTDGAATEAAPAG